MSGGGPHLDLVVLTADKNQEFALRGLFQRTDALGIRPFDFRILVHPHRDPGCRLQSASVLEGFRRTTDHALVLFDREGSGGTDPRERLEAQVEADLGGSGWGTRAAAVAIDPELEVWVWARSPHVDRVLGWRDRDPNLESWLVSSRFLLPNAPKPEDPKGAMVEALRIARTPRSSRLYFDLARTVGTRRCVDPAFLKLREVLGSWFPPA